MYSGFKATWQKVRAFFVLVRKLFKKGEKRG